jgi:hypothetical protein
MLDLIHILYKVLKGRGSLVLKTRLMDHANDQERLGAGADLRPREAFRVPLTKQETCRARRVFSGCKLWNNRWPRFSEIDTDSKFHYELSSILKA